MKYLITILILTLPLLGAGPLTQKEKNNFVEFYREKTSLRSESPQKTWVKVMFVDIDSDGLLDALASDALNTYEEAQASWAAYKNTGNKWVPFKSFHKNVYDDSAKLVNSSSVFGRPGEFYRVTRTGGTAHVLILQKNFDKQSTQDFGQLIKSWVETDKKGILKEHKINDMERYLIYNNSDLPNPVSYLELLKVETFE